jgi:hypothetical protein
MVDRGHPKIRGKGSLYRVRARRARQGRGRCAVVEPVERLSAHSFPEQDRYVDTEDLSRPKVALRMVSGGLGV